MPGPLSARLAVIGGLVFGLGTAPASAALSLTTDHRALFFGNMHLGDSKELGQGGSYHNQIVCSSTNGRTWYLKIHVLRPLSSGMHEIPLENFQWQLDQTTGHGTTPQFHQFAPFRLMPDVVYISGADEASGGSVTVQLRYRLTIPEALVAGVYQTTIRITLAEML